MFLNSHQFKNANNCLNPKLYNTEKNNYLKRQPISKGPYQMIEKPIDSIYKLIYPNKKEIIQHGNNRLP